MAKYIMLKILKIYSNKFYQTNMYSIDYTNKFKKDIKLCKKRGYDIQKIKKAIEFLENDGQVPENYLPHKLHGKLSEYWDCHIEPDWLLIYKIEDTIKLVTLVRTGTHSDIL